MTVTTVCIAPGTLFGAIREARAVALEARFDLPTSTEQLTSRLDDVVEDILAGAGLEFDVDAVVDFSVTAARLVHGVDAGGHPDHGTLCAVQDAAANLGRHVIRSYPDFSEDPLLTASTWF